MPLTEYLKVVYRNKTGDKSIYSLSDQVTTVVSVGPPFHQCILMYKEDDIMNVCIATASESDDDENTVTVAGIVVGGIVIIVVVVLVIGAVLLYQCRFRKRKKLAVLL